jgi:excisionase family DNA binding protein
MTSKEARVYLSISHTTLWKLMNNREIPFIRFNRKVLFKKADLDAFIEAHTIPKRPNS